MDIKCPFCTTPCGNDHCCYDSAERYVKSIIPNSNHSSWEDRERTLANIERLRKECQNKEKGK